MLEYQRSKPQNYLTKEDIQACQETGPPVSRVYSLVTFIALSEAEGQIHNSGMPRRALPC